MTMRHLGALVVVLLAHLGCDETPAEGPGGAGTGAGGAGGNVEGPGLAGLLVDASEQPIASIVVLACMSTTCLYGSSDADGRFVFEIEPPASVALKTHEELSKVPRWGAALEPVQIVDGALVDTGALYVPELPEGTPLGPENTDPQTLTAGDGLELTLRRADLTPALGEFLFDIAARRVPVEYIPAYPDLDEEVIAVYALHPFAAQSASPIAVRVPSDLPDGTPVSFRTISEIDGSFSAPAPGHANGSVVATDPGAGITRLTYLVVSR